MVYHNGTATLLNVEVKINEKYTLTLPVHVEENDRGCIARYRSIPPYGTGNTPASAAEALCTKFLPKFIRAETTKQAALFLAQKRDFGPDELYDMALKTVLARFNFDNSFSMKVANVKITATGKDAFDEIQRNYQDDSEE